jgi:tetratricopeptide (TPR) repeat protein/TolB-like protein
MSPEQLKGKVVDQRSDIFSLGTILYAMATGNNPFLADSSAEVISSILSHHPPEVDEVREDLPEYLSGVIRRSLEKNPDDRYQSARELEDDLEKLRDGIRSGTVPQSAVPLRTGDERREKPRPRWRVVGLAAGALIAAAIAGAIFVGTMGSTQPAPLQTVAVRPFANLTGDRELDNLAEGLSAGLTSLLRERQGLQVVGRAEAWRTGDLSATELASRLGVGSVVDGEILKQGSRLETTVILTDTGTGMVLWSNTYSAPGGEIFALQRVMAGDLTTFLSIPLSADDRRRLARDPQGADRALAYYVTGRGFLDRVDDLRGPDAAAENFRQALRLDPDFVLAHVGLSEALWEIYLRDVDRAAVDEAEVHAKKARDIAPDLPEARLALARIYRTTGRHDEALREVEAALADHPRADEVQRELGRNYERAGDLEAAERALRAATSLRPDDWTNWNALGNFLADAGKYEEAGEAYTRSAEVAPPDLPMPREKLATYGLQVGEIDAAIEIYESLPKPIRSPRLASNLATAYFFSEHPKKWERAEENYLLAVRLSPQDPMYQANLGDLYQRLEQTDEALERYRLSCELLEMQVADDPDDPQLLSDLAFYSAKANNCARSLSMAPQLEDLLPDTGPNAHVMAYIYALCGASDAAIEALARAIAHGESIDLIRQEDEFRSLRDRPDFKALVAGGG